MPEVHRAQPLLDPVDPIELDATGAADRSGSSTSSTDAGTSPGMLDPAIMGPPVVWLADPTNADVHDERITAREFDAFLRARAAAQP